jgi:hypothetical protein
VPAWGNIRCGMRRKIAPLLSRVNRLMDFSVGIYYHSGKNYRGTEVIEKPSDSEQSPDMEL